MQTLSQLQKKLENYIKSNHFTGVPEELYSPINYIMSLGGKRMRPILLLMSYNLYKKNVHHALNVAYAIELFHNFTLIHDDIMDEAPLRRGKPTVHHKWNPNIGILSGDAMLISVYQTLSKIKNKNKLAKILTIFNKFSIEVCEGQQMDMNFEQKNNVTLDEYLKMIEFKTAVLLGGSMQSGAILADASEEDAQNLYEFGRNMGIAFQIQDDILDTYAEAGDDFGKKVGGDIIQNKKTCLVIKAYNLADEKIKENLTAIFSVPTENEEKKIQDVKNIFEQLNVRAEIEALKDLYLNRALEALRKVNVNESNKKELLMFANSINNRKK